MKLELKYLAPYLPYKLQCYVKDYPKDLGEDPTDGVYTLHAVYSDGECVFHDLVESCQGFKSVMPVLRPLNDLEEYIENLYGSKGCEDITEYFDEDFLNSMDNLHKSEIGYKYIEFIPYGTMQVLFKHHFDVFGLIDQGLAIDKNRVL